MSLSNNAEELLYELLEQAAENATGGDDTDITEYIMILEDEWITDVDALRRLDPLALDELLPRLLSQELQRLMHNKDSRYRPANRNRRWRPSPQKRGEAKRPRSKPKNFPKSIRYYNENRSSPPDVTHMSEEESSSSSSSVFAHTASPKQDSNDTPKLVASTMGKKQYRSSSKKKKKKNNKKGQFWLFKMFDLFEHACSHGFKDYDKEPNELILEAQQQGEEEGIDDDQLQQISNSTAYTTDATKRAHHLIADISRKARIVANARKKCSTREALEDAIRECQASMERERAEAADADDAEVATNKKSVFDTDIKILTPAEDELSKLYPLRLILPTIADLAEMIENLQRHRERAMRNLNIEKADSLKVEIEELQYRLEEEERYLLKKKWSELECVACGEKFVPAMLSSSGRKTMKAKKERRCEDCRRVFGSVNEEEDEEQGGQPSVVRRKLSDIVNVDG